LFLDGRIAPRSGLASKHFIDTGAGVIDADYRGEVKVLLFNFSDVDFTVQEGDRVAQLILERVRRIYATLIPSRAFPSRVLTCIDLHSGSRGRGGIGRECPRSWWIWKHRY
jgi:deoxyuridine 5'-triphosphate nucleotidohydrolase